MTINCHQWQPPIFKNNESSYRKKKRNQQYIATTHFMVLIFLPRKIERKNFSSKISLWCPFIVPVLMAVNADKVLLRPSAKRQDLSKFPSNFRKTEESALNSPSASLGWGTKLGVKVGLGCEMAAKAARLIPRRAIVTLMMSGVYFSGLVPLILTRSDQALRKPRITSALFVCCRGRKRSAETLFLERSRQGHLPEPSAKQTEKHLLPLPYRI